MDIPKTGHDQAAISLTPTVTVYRSQTDIKAFMIDNILSGEDVVEGFSCQVAELFE